LLAEPDTISAVSMLERIEPQRIARLVERFDEPVCAAESEARAAGATVTRLLTNQIVQGPSIDRAAARVLGKLYDGLIVPPCLAAQGSAIAAISGLSVVFCEVQGPRDTLADALSGSAEHQH
jgi:hypothetical protein